VVSLRKHGMNRYEVLGIYRHSAGLGDARPLASAAAAISGFRRTWPQFIIKRGAFGLRAHTIPPKSLRPRSVDLLAGPFYARTGLLVAQLSNENV
jgi:hypothetical protein